MIRRTSDHDPERDVAAYVSGEMSKKDLRRFEAHLLECEVCWQGVQLNREGRRLAERGWEVAPAGLREGVRASVTLSATQSRRQRLRRLALTTLAAAAAVVIALTVVTLRPSAAQPAEIAAALTAYRTYGMPHKPPEHGMPDLTAAGLEPVGGGALRLASTPADMFFYRGSSGGRVLLFLSSSIFPEALGATENGGMARGWTARADGLSLVCGSRPTSFLLVGTDPALLRRAEQALTPGP